MESPFLTRKDRKTRTKCGTSDLFSHLYSPSVHMDPRIFYLAKCRYEHRYQIECSLRIRNFFEGTLLRNVLCRNRTAAMNWPLSVKQNAWKEPCWIMPTIAVAAAVAPRGKRLYFLDANWIMCAALPSILNSITRTPQHWNARKSLSCLNGSKFSGTMDPLCESAS